jgi:hypothetical protein
LLAVLVLSLSLLFSTSLVYFYYLLSRQFAKRLLVGARTGPS